MITDHCLCMWCFTELCHELLQCVINKLRPEVGTNRDTSSQASFSSQPDCEWFLYSVIQTDTGMITFSL